MFPQRSKDLCKLLNIQFPIIQGGMVWVSGAKLAAASSNAGILGTIGAGSMKPELLKEHIKKFQTLSEAPLAVNVPLLYHQAEEQIQTALDLGVKIFITSAGSPKKYTRFLKDKGCLVGHVTAHPELAKKVEASGCDFVIAEGFEAGGHNGRDEITTLALIPQVLDAVSLPVVAAGGFATGKSLMSGLALGAAGIQMGTRFVCALESSAHENFKNAIIDGKAGSTKLCMKELVPVRLLDNKFSKEIQALESACASSEKLKEHLGKGRAREGMLYGDIEEGELEIGQVSGLINSTIPTQKIVEQIIREYQETLTEFTF
ncbi:MAG: NAD(P)H-dependent flavin oxidoreductase [Bacteriovoracaceae bacterium]